MKIIEISIRRRVTISMVTLAIVIFGFVAFGRLDVTLLPNLTYPSLTVRTSFPGAAPIEVENLVSKPIEEAVGVVKNLIEVRSISRSGQSDVILEFEWGTNMDFAGLEVREKLDALDLPLEVKKPLVLRFDPSLDPILTFALYRDRKSESANDGVKLASHADPLPADDTLDETGLKFLRTFSEEQLKKELESIPGVAAVKISGGLEEEIQIEVDQGKLAQLNISIEEVADRLRQENVNLAGGNLKEGTHRFLVRTLNQFRSIAEIRSVILRSEQGSKIYLRDIATVAEGYKERTAIIRFAGHEAVEIAIYKEGDANTVAVARAVQRGQARIKKMLPNGVKLSPVYDQSVFIENAVNEVVKNAALGGILAFVVLYFFLRNMWTTVIICLAIPVSVIATFNLMFGGDITLNIMSLGGLALGIGMLVDNSVVVLENIFRHRERGASILEAAQRGATEVGTAVTASTLTTIAVFLPLVFVKGIAGQLFRDQALTVTFSLLASLAVAITLIPMMASLGGKKKQTVEMKSQSQSTQKEAGKIKRGFKRSLGFIFTSIPTMLVSWLIRTSKLVSKGLRRVTTPFVTIFDRLFETVNQRIYPRTLNWALSHRLVILAIAVGLFGASILFIPTLGLQLIPQLSQGEFLVEVKLPSGTPLATTDGLIRRMQTEASGHRAIQTMFSVAGTGNRLDANPEEGGENWGELRIKMVAGSDRDAEELLMSELRNRYDRLPGAEYKFSRPTLFTFKTPVEIEIAGYDLDGLKALSDDIVQKLEEIPQFKDVKATMQGGYPEIQINFDRERIAAYGLNVPDVARTVVNKVKGELATRYSLRDRKIDVLVRAREKDRRSIEHIRRMLVNPPEMSPLTLAAVANVEVAMGPGEIHRSGQQRVALVRTNLAGLDLGRAAEMINGLISSLNVPEDFSVRLAGQNQEMAVSFQSLRFALILAVFLVYLVMASQFESLLHPFVIMFTIPLALIGVIFALKMTGNSISVVVFIGLIMLAGIVVNNAIVLIDYINQLRRRGMTKLQAIKEAGKVRLRPITMTTLTTALGLLPLALGFGEGAEVRAPMAITVIGGLIVSTVLTLVVIPVVYSLVDRKP